MKISTDLFTIFTLTKAELKGRYRNTWAGFLWVALNPIIMFCVHALIFKFVLKIDTERYFIFLLSGLLPWIFISQNLAMTCHSFITNRDILLSFQISPLHILASKVIDNFLNFLAPFFILFAYISYFEDFESKGLWFLPINTVILVIGVFCLSLIFSTLQVYIRDTQYILNFITSIFYFITPIFYPESLVPNSLKFMVDYNPIYILIKPFKIVLWNFDLNLYWIALTNAFLCISILSIISYFIWRNKKNELYLHI
jgi:ABC-type polysaccharide/polyol phosphate export permease